MASIAKVPDWSLLWSMYYDYINYPDSGYVKKLIGGKVDAAWITNTCAVRLSDALNYSGVPLPRGHSGLNTVRDGAGMRVAFRVRELKSWMRHRLGKADFDFRKKASENFDKSQLGGMQGIICFDISFSDATGHLDLWDGTKFSSEYKTSRDYWLNATHIYLWECGK
jgi:hypothetical protein